MRDDRTRVTDIITRIAANAACVKQLLDALFSRAGATEGKLCDAFPERAER